ncbi:MAG: hypothetical protein CR968_00450 [Flavobacteriia bacterium]|nr:MAG: hypothetical protein CR968_00450 [Flavobacteriia bacterium]
MSKRLYVLDGAILECNQGFTPAKLLVTQNRKVKIQGKLQATNMDLQVPQTFGQCKLKPTSGGYLPCVPALQPWTKTTEKTTLGGSKKFLYDDSECMCSTGGKVTVTQHTQINTAGSVQEQFKDIAMLIPGAMMGDDKAPKVIDYFITDKEGVRIEEAQLEDIVYLNIITENLVGQSITVNLEHPKVDYIFNGERLKNVVLKDYQVKADNEKFNLKVTEQEKE